MTDEAVMRAYAELVEAGWLPPKRNGTVDDVRRAIEGAHYADDRRDGMNDPMTTGTAVMFVRQRDEALAENERLREALAALHPDVLYLRRHLARNATEDAKLALERLAATLAAAKRTGETP